MLRETELSPVVPPCADGPPTLGGMLDVVVGCSGFELPQPIVAVGLYLFCIQRAEGRMAETMGGLRFLGVAYRKNW